MSIVIENLSWMSFNVGLALLSLFLGWAFLKSKNRYFQIIFFILWFLFVPNTIYLLTDLEYLPEQLLKVGFTSQFLLLLQYLSLLVCGVLTFLFGMKPFELLLNRLKIKKQSSQRKILISLVIFLIAFGVVMGKFQRTHSWYVITDPLRVFQDALTVTNSKDQMLAVLLFGILFNIIYFVFKDKLLLFKLNN